MPTQTQLDILSYLNTAGPRSEDAIVGFCEALQQLRFSQALIDLARRGKIEFRIRESDNELMVVDSK